MQIYFAIAGAECLRRIRRPFFFPIFREAETSACGWLGAAGCPTNFRVVVFLPPYREAEAVFSAVRRVEKAGPEIRPRLYALGRALSRSLPNGRYFLPSALFEPKKYRNFDNL